MAVRQQASHETAEINFKWTNSTVVPRWGRDWERGWGVEIHSNIVGIKIFLQAVAIVEFLYGLEMATTSRNWLNGLVFRLIRGL